MPDIATVERSGSWMHRRFTENKARIQQLEDRIDGIRGRQFFSHALWWEKRRMENRRDDLIRENDRLRALAEKCALGQ